MTGELNRAGPRIPDPSSVSSPYRITLYSLEQLPLPRVLRHLLPGNEHMLRPCRQLERIAGPDDDVRVLASLQRADAIGHSPHAGGFERDRAESGVPIQAVGDRVTGLLPQVPCVVGIEGRERRASRRPSPAAQRFSSVAPSASKLGMSVSGLTTTGILRDASSPEMQPAFDGAHQNQLQIELVSQTNCREQIARAICVHSQRQLAAEHRLRALPCPGVHARRAAAGRCSTRLGFGVVPRILEASRAAAASPTRANRLPRPAPLRRDSRTSRPAP